MSTKTTGGTFTFDHGQKSLNKAIGVEDSYLDNLADQIADILKTFIFDSVKKSDEKISPSGLVEICANEFSYSQLVIMASFYLQDKIKGFSESLEKKLKNEESSIKSLAINVDDIPPHIKKILDSLTEENSKDNPIDGDSLPKEFKDFLRRLAEEQDED